MKDTLLPFLKDEKPPPKNFFTHGILPGYIEAEQLPTKKKPFSTIWGLRWLHTVDILLPVELREAVQKELAAWKVEELRYAKVIMSLGDIVEGDFFNEYVKKGVLRLELDKATYERAGLVGKPIPDGGRKHIKSRFAIELDLRHPSMIRGKKLFDRMVYAFKNVLNQSLTWLFRDCRTKTSVKEMNVDDAAPIEKHHPRWIASRPVESAIPGIRTLNLPNMAQSEEEESKPIPAFDDKEYISALEEQLALIALDSPRVLVNDTIDPYLCRYAPTSPPYVVVGNTAAEIAQQRSENAYNNEALEKIDLVRLRYHGFLQAEFVVKLFAAIKHAAKKEHGQKEFGQKETSSSQTENDHEVPRTWFAMLAHGFEDEHETVLGLTNKRAEQIHFLEWFHQKRL
ncbi:MAG: hypothetical protein M1831_005748 [Alyxoria varia]|nr:MAG: hypothetical protein M1831_005748 [Alyxoria varia]